MITESTNKKTPAFNAPSKEELVRKLDALALERDGKLAEQALQGDSRTQSSGSIEGVTSGSSRVSSGRVLPAASESNRNSRASTVLQATPGARGVAGMWEEDVGQTAGDSSEAAAQEPGTVAAPGTPGTPGTPGSWKKQSSFKRAKAALRTSLSFGKNSSPAKAALQNSFSTRTVEPEAAPEEGAAAAVSPAKVGRVACDYCGKICKQSAKKCSCGAAIA